MSLFICISFSIPLNCPILPEHLPLDHDPVPVHGYTLQLHAQLVVVADELVVVHLQVASNQHSFGSKQT